MAESDSLPNRPNTMKEAHSISSSPSDLYDDSVQESKNELEPGFIEERFRVDRKKLEQMLQGNQDENEESAEEFFQRVMDETKTQITWPSKLKIGAKSKKDPHIKVIGYPEDVKAAKDEIMTILDTKSNRVTLKMDVSHTDHSHVIGKGGNNIKRVMQETGCHIHFPDSNRGSNVQEKSNQVSIAGQPLGVESARAQIRELLPLVFMFELPPTGSLQPLPDSSSPMILQLQQQFGITINFRQRPRSYATVTVRGSVCNAANVKEGTARLMEHLLGNMTAPLPVSMQLEIAPQHHLFIIGRGGMNIRQIMQKTGANIHFPDPNNVPPQRKGTFYITGNIENVFLARQHLIGCLPLVLMFDVKDEIEMDQGRIAQLMEQLDVYISVKPKPKQPSKSVIVKSIERNAPNMYLSRLLLLGLKKDDKTLPQSRGSPVDPCLSPSNGLGISSLGFFSQNLLTVNTTNALLMMNGGSSSPTPVGSPQPSVQSTATTHWVTPPPGIYCPMMLLNPSDTGSVQAQLDLIMAEGQHIDLDTGGGGGGNYITVPASQNHQVHKSMSESCITSHGDSPAVLLGRSGSAAEISQQKLNSTFGKKATREPSPTDSSHTLDLLGLSKSTQSKRFSDSNLGRRSLENSLSRSSLPNGDRAIESDGEGDLGDQMAMNRDKSNTSSLFNSQLPFAIDYEQRKLMANKAMQKKPEGETRNPTDFWSGMGFSKSMPEAAIRDKFANKKYDQYTEPSVATTYESPNEVIEEEIDNDPWKQTPLASSVTNKLIKPLNPAPGEYPSPRKKYNLSLSSSNYVDSACLPQFKNLNLGVKTDLAELFSKLGLGKYTDLFQQQEIDLATFLTLTDQDLRELGVTTFGARRKMLLAITDLNKARNGDSMNSLLQQETSCVAGRIQGYSPASLPRPHQEPGEPRAIIGKQQPSMYSDSDGHSLQSSGRGLLHSSLSSLHSSGAGLHNSQSALHSSSASLHGSGHMTRKPLSSHFSMEGSNGGLPRQITGGFSSSGSFQEGPNQGLVGRQITGGLSASFTDRPSLHSLAPSRDHKGPGEPGGGAHHSSRPDLASISGRW